MRAIISFGLALTLAAAGSANFAAAANSSSALLHHSGSNLNIVGYSTPGPVYGSASTKGTLEYAFVKTSAGKGVNFSNSFAASDQQANAVVNGQPADVVNFSYAPNMTSLVTKKLVASGWYKNSYNGDITRSVVAFGVRPGNPKHIKGWADLVKAGISIVTPSTQLSGSARWNVLAAYAYASAGDKKASAGVAFLKKLKKNIAAEPTSGSKAVTAFLLGTGDVVIGYQDDLMAVAKANSSKIKVVTPAQSLLIENPVSVTMGSASQNPRLAKAFVSFLYSKTAQTIWAQNFYWPVLNSVYKHFRKSWVTPAKIYTTKQLGGWTKLDPKFFGTPNGIWTKIENGG